MANGPKRSMNAKKKENRKASWARGQKRHQRNFEANEQRRKDNDRKLANAGLSRTKTAVEYYVDGKPRVKYVPDSPQRTFRLAGLEYPED